MTSFLEWLNKAVWGVPLLCLILFVGIYLSLQTGFAQIRWLPKAVYAFIGKFLKRKNTEQGTSSYRSLCTALAATVGTGNIAGVAGAIAIGGPGAVFWMWICALLGMITKYAEATLAVRYREINSCGEFVGGPMYMIKNAMGHKYHWLAYAYCFFGIVASFGVGNGTQINTILGGFQSVSRWFGIGWSVLTNIFVGTILALLIFTMLIGGAGRIGTVAEMLVPYAAVAYMLLCVVVLFIRRNSIFNAVSDIIFGAFSPEAVTGGVVGSIFQSLRIGASRGVFTNEAGMGTASIAHASSNVKQPAEQGLMGIVEVFIDTIVICTMTALVILCSGVPIPYGMDIGVELTTNAFSAVLGQWVCIPIAISLCCFAFATVLGWGLYGMRCAQFLFGENSWKSFVYMQSLTTAISAVLSTGTVWVVAETVNGLMAIPNLIVLAFLAPELSRITRSYKVNNFKEICRKNPQKLDKSYEKMIL